MCSIILWILQRRQIILPFKEYTAKAGDVLEQDGKTYKYVDAAGTTPQGQTAAAAGWYAEDNTTTAADTVTLKAGSKLSQYDTATGKNNDYSISRFSEYRFK